MDYRRRKYYLIQLPMRNGSDRYINAIINILRRLPVYDRKIHLREFNIKYRCNEILISYNPEVQQKFDEVKLQILQRFRVVFVEITKENENYYCHKIMKL